MGQKKITDLTLISSITDSVNTVIDDGIQTYRGTALQLKNYIFPDDAVTLAKLADEVVKKLVPVGSILNMALSDVPDGFVKCNGAALSRTTYADLFQKLVTDTGFSAQTFTITIAAPGVVTKSSHGFKGGERIRLTTTGALPTGLSAGSEYFVNYIDANTFRLQAFSNVLAGTYITTTGSQSGTHSYTRTHWGLGDGSTTFNAPDLRGAFLRAWDDARALDTDRAMATFQMDAIQNITGATAGRVLGTWYTPSGAFGHSSVAASLYGGGGGNGANMNFDASRVVRTTSDDSRPKSYALMPVIKY